MCIPGSLVVSWRYFLYTDHMGMNLWLAGVPLIVGLCVVGCDSPGDISPAGPRQPTNVDASFLADGSARDGGGRAICEPSAAPSIRRLNRREYLNSVRDLFPTADLSMVTISEDPRPFGFDNDANALVPSTLLVEEYHQAANRISAEVMDTFDVWGGCALDEVGCIDSVIRTLGERVFRRPLSEAEVGAFMTLGAIEPGLSSPSIAMRLVVQAMLQAPQFLYRPEVSLIQEGRLGPWEVASRLSYFIWATMPDSALMEAARADALSTSEQIEAHARRMLDDPRAEATVSAFYSQWMEVDRIMQATKVESDGLDDATRHAMVEEADRFAYDILFEGGGTLTDLLTSRRTMVNSRLAELYGLPPVPAGEWVEVELDASRAGFLTRLAFLAGHGHPTGPSPVLRGHFILKRLLCLELGPPPPGAETAERPTMDAMGRPLTNREAYDLTTSGPGCTGCHALINPLGYALENFDTMGRYQTLDHGQMIDASGTLASGVAFNDAADLVGALADDDAVGHCLTEAWLRYAYAGGEEASNACVEQDVSSAFMGSGFNLRELIVHIVTQPQFFTGQPEEPGAGRGGA